MPGAYGAYEVVRGLVGVNGYKPFGDATRIIGFERSLHVFWEPAIQSWVMSHTHWLLDIADWTYLNAHFALTFGALAFIYLRRNDSFYFVRNMFMIAMLIALVGYSIFPTAPPRLMPEWGFTDAIQQATHVTVEHGVGGALLNAYAGGAVDARLLRADDRAADVAAGAPPDLPGAVARLPAVHRVRGDRDRQPLLHRRLPRRPDRGYRSGALEAAAGSSPARDLDLLGDELGAGSGL